jgi:23S rRNA (uracil1939-C5)-methyltransferase
MKEKFNPELVKCIDLSFEGKGVTKTSYGVCFVDGLFPGEEAYIEIQYRRAGNLFGKVTSLVKKSPHRIQPLCGVCSACGGCQFQQLDYDAQLEYKTKKVKEALERNKIKGIEVLPCLGMKENPYNYRNKIQVPLGLNKHGKIISGFYRANTHEIIAIDECFIEDVRAKSIVKNVKQLMKEFHYSPYNEDTGEGLIRHLIIRTSYHYKQIMLTIVTAYDEFKGRNNFVKALKERCPEITTIVQNINKRRTNVILGEKERILYGTGHIKDSILGVDFIISSKSFFQVNPIQVEVLYKKAIEFAELKETDDVFDAYCGTGTIGLIAAKQAKSVLGVEIVGDAIKNAKNNAEINRISNSSFIVGDAGKVIEDLANNNKRFDVVFVDPPRKGLDEKFINTLLKIKPERIVYVSCEPETLARDLAILNKSYVVKKVQPVDMFPMTYHVETIVGLYRK